MKEVRGIDLDEILFETVDQALEFHDHKINGKEVSKKDISDYHFYKVKEFGINKEDAIKWFSDFLHSKDVDKIQPVVGAKKVLESLQKKWIEGVGITWRLEEYKNRTTQALEKYYSQLLSDVIYLWAYADIHSEKITQKTKSEVCKEIWATVMVEDDLHYAQELAENGIKVYLIAKPRNSMYQNGMHPNIIKISWREKIPV